MHTAGVLIAPCVLARRDRWHWLTAVAVVGAFWQLVAVKTVLMNTTMSPYLGTAAGVMVVIAWRVARGPRGY